jgi:hypothetical protein
MNTVFSDIQFNSQFHTYTLNGQILHSVTKRINSLKPAFDSAYWAQRKADERGVTADVILAEWEAKRQAGFDKGNRMHAYIQQVLKGETTLDPFLALSDRLPDMDAFDRAWATLQGVVTVEQCEWIVGDAGLGVAGTLDALLLDQRSGLYHIWDWKTGSKFNLDNRFQRLLVPFDDLDDCELVVYSLQVSLYRLIIERNLPSLLMGDCYIAQLSDNWYQFHKALDLRDRLLQWLGGQDAK